jgi:hypothetical protein
MIYLQCLQWLMMDPASAMNVASRSSAPSVRHHHERIGGGTYRRRKASCLMYFATKRSLPKSMDPAILGLLLDVTVPMPRLHEYHFEPMVVMVLLEMLRVNVHLAMLGSPPSTSCLSSSRVCSKAHRLRHLLEVVDRFTWAYRLFMYRLWGPTHSCLTGLLWCFVTGTHPTKVSKFRRQLANGRENELEPGGKVTSPSNVSGALLKPVFPTESPSTSNGVTTYPFPPAFTSSCKPHSTSLSTPSSYRPLSDSTNVWPRPA